MSYWCNDQHLNLAQRRLDAEQEDARRRKQQRYAAAYAAGQIRQGLIAGEYPPPDPFAAAAEPVPHRQEGSPI